MWPDTDGWRRQNPMFVHAATADQVVEVQQLGAHREPGIRTALDMPDAVEGGKDSTAAPLARAYRALMRRGLISRRERSSACNRRRYRINTCARERRANARSSVFRCSWLATMGLRRV